MNWPRFVVGCAAILGGFYLAHLHTAHAEYVIGGGLLLVDPVVVLKAIGLWKGGSAAP